MDYFIICLVALLGSGLTLFSGFGLGTLLVPVFAIFFPLDLAIALTAIVHFLNNLFKLALLYRSADWKIVLRFGLPSLLAAFVGAYVLTQIGRAAPLYNYTFAGHEKTIVPIKLVIGILLVFFAIVDIVPKLSSLQFDKKYLVAGGLLSGFFGGLSGNQGALRSAFLIKAGLTKEAYIATGVVIACLTDMSRLSVYWEHILDHREHMNLVLVFAATLSAFAGAYFGNKLVKKITVVALQRIVALALMLFGILLALGMI